MLPSIWDDISHEVESIPVSKINYNPLSLIDKLYDLEAGTITLRQLLKTNKIQGSLSQIDLMQSHCKTISSDTRIEILITKLFKVDEISTITPVDKIFINAYYRKLLRANVEQSFMGKELRMGAIITDYNNELLDTVIAETLIILRIICKYLGLESTLDAKSFHINKLYHPSFWDCVLPKFIPLFGENTIPDIINYTPDTKSSNNKSDIQTIINQQAEINNSQMQVLRLLNIIFNIWSGSMLIIESNLIKVIPRTYVLKLIPKLK